MVSGSDKRRGLTLAGLLVLSLIGGVVTLSGSAAAAGNDVGIDAAIEADGTVEVIFNTSTFSDPPESSDVDVWIDGTRVIDDGASDTNLGGQTWSVGYFGLSGSNATFKLETDGTPQDIDPNRNLTVEFEDVARSGATNTDPETQVTVTQAVVTRGGSNDTVDNAQRIYQGDDIAIEGTSSDTDVFLNTTGQDLSTGTDSRYLTVSTVDSAFNTGEITEVEFNNDATDVQYFELLDLGLTATATDTSIDDETALTVDVSSNRGGAPLTATLRDGDDTEVETVTSDFAGDGTATLDFGTQSAGEGPYTVRVVDNTTNASATTNDITVAAAAPSGIDTAVEAGGNVEVVFNTSTFDDPPESGDVNIWVDGTRVVDGGASDTNLGGQTWTISGFSQSGRSASFTIQTDGSAQDIAANRNLTVEFEDVTRSGGNPEPGTSVTTTAAVVNEGGSADSEGSAQRIYGGDIAIEATSTDADVFVVSTGQALRTGPDSDLLVLDSAGLPDGVTELQFDGDETNDQFVDRTGLGLAATATDTSIDDETALTVDVSAVRGSSGVTATLVDDGTPVETTTETLDATGDTTVDFGTQSSGAYTVRVVDNESNVSATTATISVSSGGGGGGGGGSGGGGGNDDVVYDPAEIGTLVDLPDDVRPVAGEQASVVLTSAGGEATFTGDAAVEYVGFDEYVPGVVAVAAVDRVDLGTAPVAGRTLTAAQVDAPDGTADANWTLRMHVDSADLAAAGANASDLRILRFEDGEWTPLNTSVHSQNEGGVVVAAETSPGEFFAVRASAPPTAAADASAATVAPGNPVVLDGSASTTQFGDIVASEWTVDGRTLNGSVVTVTFDDPGTYSAEFTITNDVGETATETTTVTVAADGSATGTAANDPAMTDNAGATNNGTTAGSGPGFGVATAMVGVVLGLLARGRTDR